MSKVLCSLCPNNCNLGENQRGLCRARKNVNGKIISINYGQLTSISLDPIEKKPLMKFYPGKHILSVGSFACNLKCPFCQNHELSMASEGQVETQFVKPEELIKMALDLKDRGNIGVAYTYNEPLIGYEYVRDCAILARENHLNNVLVTNGCFNEESVRELLAYIDAINVDLKGFTEEFYRKVGGDLKTVKNFISLASKYCHLEVTTLVIPGENDSENEIREISGFIASINPNIPLHLSRFFPCYKMIDKNPTEIDSIYHLANIAREKLKYVYEGNC